MKVLSKGSGWKLQQTCTGGGNGGGGCQSELEVEDGDVFVTARHCYDGSSDYYYTFRCPVCSTNTDITPELVPYRIRTEAMKKYRQGEAK